MGISKEAVAALIPAATETVLSGGRGWDGGGGGVCVVVVVV